MRWACILLPQLALDTVLRQQVDPAAPLALVSGPVQRRVLHAVNATAREAGLRRGMALTTAQLLTPEVHLLAHDPKSETQAREMLAAWAYRFSSLVSLAFAHSIVLEIRASRALFGGWSDLGRRLSSELTELGFSHRLVAAPNPFAARILCNVHRGLGVDEAHLSNALGAVPVTRSGLPTDAIATLERSGMRQLRQVFVLPRESLARRFAPTVLQHLDALRGGISPPLPYYAPPDRFEARIEFEYEVESSQALLFPLRRLTADLATFLAARDGGVQRFTLYFEHERHLDSQLSVGLLAAEREAHLLFELSRSRLEQLRLPAGTRGMRLVAEELPPFVPAGRDLFDARPQQAVPWEQLRERLRARLGDDAVQGITLQADHRPERATRLGAISSKRGDPAPSPLRPAWLLPQPIPLRGIGHVVVGGEERIETGWWDGSDVRRDYAVIRTREGQHAWAFQVASQPGQWWLQGWFA